MKKKKIKLVSFFIILCILFCSCTSTKRSTSTVTVYDTIIRDNYIEKLKYDSIYLHDSIYTIIKGDSVFIYKDRYKYKYLYMYDTINKSDTVYLNKVDYKEVIKEKPKYKYAILNILLLVIIGTYIIASWYYKKRFKCK